MTARMVHLPILLRTAPMADVQQMLLKLPACFAHSGPQIVAFGRRKAAVPQESCRDPDMLRVSIVERGGSAVAEEMRVDTPAESGVRTLNNPVVDRLLGHRGSVRRDPKRVPGRPSPTARESQENR